MTEFLTGLLWLTLNVYHEARSEPDLGQIAVAHVTLNRAHQKQLPLQEIVRAPSQFSWVKQGRFLPDDVDAFVMCMKNVSIAVQGFDFTNGATHYHREDVYPYWADQGEYVAQFGVHKFYTEIKW